LSGSLDEIERVEILIGPQSSLYRHAAFAGAITGRMRRKAA
jgi:outer membrane receptor for ferrienterochelin and colicin